MNREVETEKLAAALLVRCAEYAGQLAANHDLTGAQKRHLVDLRLVLGMAAIRDARAANTDEIED